MQFSKSRILQLLLQSGLILQYAWGLKIRTQPPNAILGFLHPAPTQKKSTLYTKVRFDGTHCYYTTIIANGEGTRPKSDVLCSDQRLACQAQFC
jgi:hypothetical protein